MGTGTNVQKRLEALHELDAPWKPAEVEQREGRILRQGNENEEVAIYRYVTEQSFDAFMWQALETKARFISQVMTGDNAARRAEDVGGQELSYAEVKAIASGNPAVLTLAEADAELQRLNILKRNHHDEQYIARRSRRDLPESIARLKERLSKLVADQATLKAHEEDAILIGDRASSDPMSALGRLLDAMPQFVMQDRRVPLGIYRGLRFGMVLHPEWTPEVYVEGAVMRKDTLSREHQGPRAVLNAVERLARGYGVESERTRQDLGIAEAQLRDYEARLGQPFPHAEYMDQLAALRDQLKAGLSGAAPQEGEPSVAELAERIKGLQAANTVEATPERTATRKVAAEEPVTSRIRRRSEAITATDPATVPDAGASSEATAPSAESTDLAIPRHHTPAGNPSHQNGSSEDASGKPEMTYQERVAPTQRQKERQASLF